MRRASLAIAAANGIGYGMAPPDTDSIQSVRRRFIRVKGRGVHYLRAGEGPPVVLLHSAILSARFELPLMHRLATDHAVFAFDHPGFGDSDPIAHRNATIADAADMLEATLRVLGVPRCPVYGSHTGAVIALELALRHRSRVAALLFNGIPVFGRRDTAYLLSERYLPSCRVTDDGSHLFSEWVKTRDQTMWFPWSRRTARTRLSWPLPSAQALHDVFLDKLRAGDAYRILYGAAFKVDVRKRVAALQMPATFMVESGDILAPHIQRLAPLKANQKIVCHAADGTDYVSEMAQVLRNYRVRANAPREPRFRPTAGAINRRYIDLAGGQILVRSAGEAKKRTPVVLLHDGCASSRSLEPLMRELARSRATYALDLPDNGASDALAMRIPGVDDYADAVAEVLAALRLKSYDIYAIGAGAAVALELASRSASGAAHVVLDTPEFYEASFARHLARHGTRPMKPVWDGAHLNRIWLMLRDEFAFWPWFDKSPAAACALDAPTDWQEMHARATDILRSLATCHRLSVAALRYEWAGPLRRTGKRSVTIAVAADDPRRRHAENAAQRARLQGVVVLPRATRAKAREILRLLRA